MAGVTDAIREHRPDAVMVQGDTTTSFVAGLAAFYEKVPVLHVEAGLRTDDRYDPFPEEMNRRLTSQLASLHFAPTATLARQPARRRHRRRPTSSSPGNTVIDALLDVVAPRPAAGEPGPGGARRRPGGAGHQPPPGVVGRADGAHRGGDRPAGQGVPRRARSCSRPT